MWPAILVHVKHVPHLLSDFGLNNLIGPQCKCENMRIWDATSQVICQCWKAGTWQGIIVYIERPHATPKCGSHFSQIRWIIFLPLCSTNMFYKHVVKQWDLSYAKSKISVLQMNDKWISMFISELKNLKSHLCMTYEIVYQSNKKHSHRYESSDIAKYCRASNDFFFVCFV